MWIEIVTAVKVAYPLPSPSARKVWIEIYKSYQLYSAILVTFRKEGVD